MTTLRMDMHLHTYRSFDCRNAPGAILRAARERGLDRLIVTDHNEIRGAFELRERDPERIVVGEEVKTREGFDVIGILLHTLIPRGTPARETCERIHDQGGIVYLPHPFDGSRAGSPRLLDSLAELIDVVEVHNARCFPASLNRRALEWATERGKLMGSGSDAHTIAELGRGYVELPHFEKNRESLLAALSAARVTGTISTSPVYRLASNWAKIMNRISPAPS
jgi:predicted metal-dependent phosphoesterase TrpH